MPWVLIAVFVFAAIGFAYYWATTAEQRRQKRRRRRLSPRQARRAEMHALDDQDEAERITMTDREVATWRGARRLLRWGPVTGAGGHSSAGDVGADGDADSD